MQPQPILDFIQEHRDHFKPGALVTDVCGIKTAVMEAARVLPEQVDFIGCHPMAGKETSKLENAEATLFRNAHFILTPRPDSDLEHVALMERMGRYMGFRDVIRTTPEQHDAIIAYTSQVMHIMAVAVCDDPDLFDCKGFEGGSFRDCTRVAALDVPLWTQLFSLNAPALTRVIRRLEDNLRSYRQVIEAGDTEKLAEKLTWSSQRKRQMNLEARRGDDRT
jgi:prephenate dehydrogenase